MGLIGQQRCASDLGLCRTLQVKAADWLHGDLEHFQLGYTDSDSKEENQKSHNQENHFIKSKIKADC